MPNYFDKAAPASAGFRRRFLYFLLPGLYQAAIPFVTLPLTTRVLGPSEFALFSVAGAVAAMLAAISQLGSVFVLAQRFRKTSGEARRELVSTIFFQTLLTSVVGVLLALALWPTIQGRWDVASDITLEIMTFPLLASVGTSLYTLAGSLAVHGHAPGYFSLLTISKVSLSAIVTLIALFGYDQGVLSLFLGQFAAGMVDLFGATLLMLPFLAWRFDRAVARDTLFLGGWSGLSQFAMQGRQLVERSVLSSTAGLHALGLFVHAQQYQNYTMLGVRPIQKAIMPVMLEEADHSVTEFRQTARASRVLYAAITALALGFAFLGKEFLHLLTNGKFDAAAPYATLFIASVLLQTSGRPQFALLLTQGGGRYLSICNVAAVAVAVGLLLWLAPSFGIGAGVAAIFCQHVVFRLGTEFNAWRKGRLPFQDLHVFVGIALIGIVVGIVQLWEPGLGVRVGLLACGLILIAVINLSVIWDLVGQVQTVLGMQKVRQR